jgi:SSS family solute:Na+ symporter
MHALDWGVLALYGAVVLAIGWRGMRKKGGTNEYFRAGRRLPWWAVGLSIIATAFSAASLLGGPGEGFGHGFLWLQLQLGDLLGYALVCSIMIPVFVRLDITTAYEYLERRFDPKTRVLGAACFNLFVVSRLGALLFGAALVLAEATGWSVGSAIIVVGVVCVFYTAAGGMEAVIWTDVLQFAMILVGVGAALAVLASSGLGDSWSAAAAAGRTQVFDFTWNPASIRSFPTAFFAYGILAFAVAGTNQQTVQRYVSLSSATEARKAAMLGWAAGAIGVGATLLLGVLLFGFYHNRPDALPAGLKPDRILAHFTMTQLPVGVAGIMVAAIFAAAMSSIDSALHSLSTSIVVDFYRRFIKKSAPEAHYLRVAKGLIVVWGVLAIAAAFYVHATGQALLPFLIKYTSYFLGPVLGLFLLGLLVPKAGGGMAFWSALAAVVLLLLNVQLKVLSLPGIWNSAATVVLTLLIGMVAAAVNPQKAPEKKLLWRA